VSGRPAIRRAALGAALAALACPAACSGAPRITARSALLVEAATGTPVFGRAALHERPIASTTKLMTALVTVQRRRLSDVLTVPPYSATASEAQIGLRTGERLRVADLLRALLLPSAGDAAETLAVRVGGSRAGFVRAMNREARRLELHRTHFTTPVGLDSPGNYSDAFDLARLAAVVRANPFLRRTVDLPRAVLRSGAHPRVVLNRNRLVRLVPWVDGVKTGHTAQAGYVLVGSATRHGQGWISVVLGTPSEAARDSDTLALLRYGFSAFRRARPVRRGQVATQVSVRGHPGERVGLVAARGFQRVERRSERDLLVVRAPRRLTGPLRAHAPVGTLLVKGGPRTLARIPLLTERAVPAPPAAGGVGHLVGRPITLMLGAVLVGGAVLALRRRRSSRDRGKRAGIGTT
jgi:D-alanyl-D-alanine carboxypeptidase (penicillin-binding protein 5/6)